MKLSVRCVFLIFIACFISACGDQASSIFGDCEIIDKETEEVVDSREQVTEVVCKNLAVENEGDVFYRWERDEDNSIL